MGHNRTVAAFNERGWFHVKTGPQEFEWQKICEKGNLLARQGEDTWHDDHAAVMLELGHG